MILELYYALARLDYLGEFLGQRRTVVPTLL